MSQMSLFRQFTPWLYCRGSTSTASLLRIRCQQKMMMRRPVGRWLLSPLCHVGLSLRSQSWGGMGTQCFSTLAWGRCLGTGASRSLSSALVSHTCVTDTMAMHIWLELTQSHERLNNSCAGRRSESRNFPLLAGPQREAEGGVPEQEHSLNRDWSNAPLRSPALASTGGSAPAVGRCRGSVARGHSAWMEGQLHSLSHPPSLMVLSLWKGA